MSAFSTPARLMMQPFRGYAQLAKAGDEDPASGQPTIVTGMARLLFVLGAFVSLTATGRLAPFELLSAVVSFAYVPILHFVAMAAALRVVARTVDLRRAYALYAEGYGPWFLLMLVVAAGALFFSRPPHLPATTSVLFLGTSAWGGVLTYACFRVGLGLSRGRAALAMVIHYSVVTALVLLFFTAAGQLLPILP